MAMECVWMALTHLAVSVTLDLLESSARPTLMTVLVWIVAMECVTVDGINSFNCICDPGFTGELCQASIDDCVGVDCSMNGQCVDGVNSFECVCDPGFTSELCQTNIDDCVGVDCGNGVCGWSEQFSMCM